MKFPRFIPGLTLSAFFCLVPSMLRAALVPTDVVWDGPDNGLFNTAVNWVGDTLPNTTNRAVINSGGPNVSLSGTTNPNTAGLSLASGFTLSRSAADTTNRTLQFTSPTVGDRYNIHFNNAGTIASGGTSGSLTLTFNLPNTTAYGELVNSGTIEATAGTTLTLSRGGQGSANGTLSNFSGETLGTLKTSGSGTLTFTGEAQWAISGGNLANDEGTLNFRTRSRANFTNVAFTNGGVANFEELTNANSGGNGFTLSGTTTLTNTGTINLSRDTTQNTYSTATSATIASALATTSINNSGTINIRTIGDTAGTGGGAGFDYTGVAQTLTNTGTINLESQSTLYSTFFSSAITTGTGVTIEGSGGEIVMKVGTGGSVDRVLITGSNGVITQSAGHTVRGAGNIGDGQLATFTNNGTVLADNASHALTIDPRNHTQLSTGVGTFVNNGTVRASGAGGLILKDGKFTNNGTFLIETGSSLTQNAAVRFTNNAARTLDIQGAWNSGTGGGGLILNAGHISYDSASDSANTIGITGAGTFTKDGTGTLTLNGANSLTGATVIDGGTLVATTGNGATFTATTVNGNYNVTTTDTSGLVVGQLITGTGIAAGSRITGILSATVFTMSSNASSSQASTSLTTAAYSSLGTGAATVNTGGTLVLGTGNHTVASLALNGGTLAGTGTLTGLVTTGGTSSVIAPGNSPGTLTLASGLDASAGATFNFELGTSSDLLEVGAFTGSINAGGLLFNFSDAGDFTTGTAYTLINFTSISGLDYADLATGSIASGYVLDTAYGTGGWFINEVDGSLLVQFSAIPEPSTYAALLASSALGVAAVRRRRRTIRQ